MKREGQFNKHICEKKISDETAEIVNINYGHCANRGDHCFIVAIRGLNATNLVPK